MRPGGAVSPPGQQADDGSGQRDRDRHQEGGVHPARERGAAEAGDHPGDPRRRARGHRRHADRDRLCWPPFYAAVL
jgi:hypothetical protein